MNRLKKAQQIVQQEGLESLIIENPIDLFYLTQLKLSLGRLWITQEDCTLLVDGRYMEMAQSQAPCRVESYENKMRGGKVGFDALTTTYSQFQDLQKMASELVPLEGPIKSLRQIKEASEIELLKKAAELGHAGYQEIKKGLKEGVTEWEMAIELEIYWKRHGGDKPSFDPIIAFGPATSQPHYRAGKTLLKKNDIILMDIGVMKENYASDMTRVHFFGTPPSKEMEQIYQIVDEAKAKAIEKCFPGALMKEVDGAAREVIEKAGYKDFFPHSLGHGVGLEVHEWPTFKKPFEMSPLKAGMVITIEPGIYLPGKGGVRLEDTIVITSQGAEIL